MKIKRLERNWADLDAPARSVHTVTSLTEVASPQWAGVVNLGASGVHTLDARKRHDLYVLRGDVEIDGQSLHADDFAIQCGPAALRAGRDGARVFLYSEVSDARCEPVVHRADERTWHDGRNPLMRVAPLSRSGHLLSLVAWQPGARTGDHAHSHGEEIFVLSGELRNANHRYPAGTWLRLHPGVRHEPFAEIPTVILLRNGHLHATSGS